MLGGEAMSAQIHSPSRRLAQTWSTASPRPAHSARRGSRGSPRRSHGREARPLAIAIRRVRVGNDRDVGRRARHRRGDGRRLHPGHRGRLRRARARRGMLRRALRALVRARRRARVVRTSWTPSDRPVATQPAVPRLPRQQAQPPRSHLTKDEVPPPNDPPTVLDPTARSAPSSATVPSRTSAARPSRTPPSARNP